MNIAYFRNSTFGYQETVENAKREARAMGFSILGETPLPDNTGTVLHICNPTWLGNLMAADANLIGLLPCSLAIINGKDAVTIGAGSPAVLGGVSRHPAISALSQQAEDTITELIHKAGGIKPRKAVALKVYATSTCPYCKAEASWLKTQNVPFKEVRVDENQQEAEAMVKKTGQMGVPVTEVTYEDGEQEYIVGFDQHRLTAIVRSMK